MGPLRAVLLRPTPLTIMRVECKAGWERRGSWTLGQRSASHSWRRGKSDDESLPAGPRSLEDEEASLSQKYYLGLLCEDCRPPQDSAFHSWCSYEMGGKSPWLASGGGASHGPGEAGSVFFPLTLVWTSMAEDSVTEDPRDPVAGGCALGHRL